MKKAQNDYLTGDKNEQKQIKIVANLPDPD